MPLPEYSQLILFVSSPANIRFFQIFIKTRKRHTVPQCLCNLMEIWWHTINARLFYKLHQHLCVFFRPFDVMWIALCFFGFLSPENSRKRSRLVLGTAWHLLSLPARIKEWYGSSGSMAQLRPNSWVIWLFISWHYGMNSAFIHSNSTSSSMSMTIELNEYTP